MAVQLIRKSSLTNRRYIGPANPTRQMASCPASYNSNLHTPVPSANLLGVIILGVVNGNRPASGVSNMSRGFKDISCDAYLPLGSVCADHFGVHLETVPAQEGGKCSSNMVRYQYLN